MSFPDSPEGWPVDFAALLEASAQDQARERFDNTKAISPLRVPVDRSYLTPQSFQQMQAASVPISKKPLPLVDIPVFVPPTYCLQPVPVQPSARDGVRRGSRLRKPVKLEGLVPVDQLEDSEDEDDARVPRSAMKRRAGQDDDDEFQPEPEELAEADPSDYSDLEDMDRVHSKRRRVYTASRTPAAALVRDPMSLFSEDLVETVSPHEEATLREQLRKREEDLEMCAAEMKDMNASQKKKFRNKKASCVSRLRKKLAVCDLKKRHDYLRSTLETVLVKVRQYDPDYKLPPFNM